MRILVIGGTRFIGPRVIRRLLKNGHEVGVFYRGEHEAALPTAVRRFKDPRAGMPVTEIPEELRHFQPEVVLHMIAMGERDAEIACKAFTGVARRLVVLSSGDVYRAYGVFKGTEPGPIEPVPLRESAALRTRLYPYRRDDLPRSSFEYDYEKILVEQAVAADSRLPATILRLPKVYGPDDNQELNTVYGFKHHPQWRFVHGYVENVGAAIALAVMDQRASGRIYNVGEAFTPTISERLAYLPPNPRALVQPEEPANFEQDITYDTACIRADLGYMEEVSEPEAMRRVVTAAAEFSRSAP